VFQGNLIFVSGKGGVGKSAVTAALAILAARDGKRVLALGLTDTAGLAGHLRAERVGYEPTEVRRGLSIASVDRARALDEYLKLQLRVPQAVPTKPLSNALNVLVDTAPGIREIVSIGKPIYEVWRGTWDLVVVDAPPTGQIESYLGAPVTIRELVPAGIVQDQARSLADTLQSPATGLILVSTPSELSVLETIETADRLRMRADVPNPALIANRVFDELGISGEVVEELPDGPARDAALLHEHLYQAQEHWLRELGASVELPFLFGLLTPGEVAARLARVLEETG